MTPDKQDNLPDARNLLDMVLDLHDRGHDEGRSIQPSQTLLCQAAIASALIAVVERLDKQVELLEKQVEQEERRWAFGEKHD